MNKNILRIIVALLFSILYGLTVKYLGYDVAILTILIMIYAEIFIRNEK